VGRISEAWPLTFPALCFAQSVGWVELLRNPSPCGDDSVVIHHSSKLTQALARRRYALICPSGKSVQFCPMSFRANASRGEKLRAPKNEFRELIQSDLGCQFSTHKYFSF
jgi:hypothetical protein